MNCTEPYMQYMEVPLTNPSQILDGFFNSTPEQNSSPAQDTEIKDDFEPVKVNYM